MSNAENSHLPVSVVIPTYNAAEFIETTLESVFNQTRSAQEILVVDDCSTDQTEQIVNSISQRSNVSVSFFRLDRNSGSPSRPLNVGIAKAQGAHILTLDQDDLWRPNKIELSVEALDRSTGASFSIGRFSIMGLPEGDLSPIWPTTQFSEIGESVDSNSEFSLVDQRVAYLALMKKNFAGTCSNFCFTKQLWQQLGGFDETIKTCADLDFVLRAVMCTPLAIVNEIILDYRWRVESLNHSNTRKTDLELSKVRLSAASMRPEWVGDERQELENCGLHAAKVALRHGDLLGAGSMFRLLLKTGSILSVLKRKLASA